MGLPGMRRMDHVGFTVPDLEAAHTWLVDVLGATYLYELGPFSHPDEDDDWMVTHLRVHPRATMRNRWYRVGGETMLEVFEYSSPDQRDAIPRNSDIGGHHVALYVDDIDAAIEHLCAHGVEVFDGPTASKGPVAVSASWPLTYFSISMAESTPKWLAGSLSLTSVPLGSSAVTLPRLVYCPAVTVVLPL